MTSNRTLESIINDNCCTSTGIRVLVLLLYQRYRYVALLGFEIIQGS